MLTARSSMVLTSGEECSPPGHPAFATDPASDFHTAGLAAYNVALDLTEEQQIIADYWSDGPGATGTPPGHWIAIVSQIARDGGLSLAAAAEAYARVGIAVHDAFMACWNTKYNYNLQRPVTYINDNIGVGWSPYLVTPGFPSYTSGHSTQSGAAAYVLTEIFGSTRFTDTTHTDHGLEPPQEPRTFDNDDGLASGQCIGQAITDRVRFRNEDDE